MTIKKLHSIQYECNERDLKLDILLLLSCDLWHQQRCFTAIHNSFLRPHGIESVHWRHSSESQQKQQVIQVIFSLLLNTMNSDSFHALFFAYYSKKVGIIGWRVNNIYSIQSLVKYYFYSIINEIQLITTEINVTVLLANMFHLA